MKRPTDSVIYKAYPPQYSKTKLAREKRMIERMNTMPNIKISINGESSSSPVDNVANHKRMVERFKTLATLPVKEMEEWTEEISSQGKTERTYVHSMDVIPVLEMEELHSDNNQSDS